MLVRCIHSSLALLFLGTVSYDHGQLPAFFEAGSFAGMAGRSHLIDFNQNGIPIAIQCEGLHILGSPEVSPLRQYSCLDLDQNVTRPVIRVRRMASSFM